MASSRTTSAFELLGRHLREVLLTQELVRRRAALGRLADHLGVVIPQRQR